MVNYLLSWKTFQLLSLPMNDTMAGYNSQVHGCRKVELQLDRVDKGSLSSGLNHDQSFSLLMLLLMKNPVKLLRSCHFTAVKLMPYLIT